MGTSLFMGDNLLFHPCFLSPFFSLFYLFFWRNTPLIYFLTLDFRPLLGDTLLNIPLLTPCFGLYLAQTFLRSSRTVPRWWPTSQR